MKSIKNGIHLLTWQFLLLEFVHEGGELHKAMVEFYNHFAFGLLTFVLQTSLQIKELSRNMQNKKKILFSDDRYVVV